MSNLGPINMAQHLREAAKEQNRQARGQGAILRPKPGIPANPPSLTAFEDSHALNGLHRYGARLVVWNFAYTMLVAPGNGERLARVPKDFYPEAPVRIAGWGSTLPNENGYTSVDFAVQPAFFLLDVDGWLLVMANTMLAFSGSVAYTSAP